MNKDYEAVVVQVVQGHQGKGLKSAEAREEFLLLQIVRKLCDLEDMLLEIKAQGIECIENIEGIPR